MEIAVLVDSQDHVAHFEQGGTVKIFKKVNDAWHSVKEMSYTTQGLNGPQALRERLSEVCRWMGSCKVIVAEKFRGTYGVVFERFQIAMWAMEGFSHMCVQEFLGNIAQFYIQEQQDKGLQTMEKVQSPVPVEIRTGYFFIDLADVMAHRTTLNSRQVLVPFFQSVKFTELEILCEHAPKWFENELSKLHLRAEEENYQNRVKIRVCPIHV